MITMNYPHSLIKITITLTIGGLELKKIKDFLNLKKIFLHLVKITQVKLLKSC